MPTKRKSKLRHIEKSELSETALWVLGDQVLYPEPEKINKWELIIAPGLDYPSVHPDKCKTLWDSAKDEILVDWIRKYPGTRPSFWWLFDAVSQRKRSGGIGDPAFEHLAYSPSYHLGIPDIWISPFEQAYYNGKARNVHGSIISTDYKDGDFTGKPINANDPPTFESQATYLRRLALLQPGELQRLKAKDFEPEVVPPAADEGETVN